ncbi:ribonuclease P protein subunit p30 isoform X4 [Leucoraja erinacea]|uniref:ribonuclease P protein subunit p30 isoform X4 n=1 Tax=Leucoraja erinaceus TaxID=7782 RepID=UPI002457601D|nr:ribonuclease P protein subunit p30 isoform X4 [Leucoraja erinacea]
MVCFADLNIININDKKRLQTIIETAAHLGYSTVAINHVLDFQQKEQGIANPISVAELFPSPPIVQGKSKPIKIMTRLTLIASDVSHYNQLVACMTLDIDLICIQGNSKLPFRITRPPVNGAIARGIYFELTYFPAINDFTLRRYTISNGICLMNVCKGKNVIVSSATEEFLGLRGPYDISNFGILFGLSEEDAKAAVSTNCRAVVLHGATRKTALGVIHTTRKVAASEGKDEGRPRKKTKTEHNG